jgi:hypothetical protein
MTDEFLTNGLRDDRYLKALRLIEQFEDEIEAILLESDRRMVDEHPDLFDPNAEPGVKTNRSPSTGLAYHRVNHPMTGPRAPDADRIRKLNVHLYWMPPTEYGHTAFDGALRAFGYKIKYADPDTDDGVVERTRGGDWSLETSGNPYDSNAVFYSHVDSAAEIEGTANELVAHFSAFGDEYAGN